MSKIIFHAVKNWLLVMKKSGEVPDFGDCSPDK